MVGCKKDMEYYKDVQPWIMDDTPVSVAEDNDHLGLIVSGISEETKNVDLKLKKARGALFNLIGPVFSYKCLLSPSLQLHLFRTFVSPIALSGLAAMTLRDNSITNLTMFHRKILRGFLHLSKRAPIPSLHFLTGEIPIVAYLHKNVFSLFYNIWCNPHTKIFEIVSYLLKNCPENSHTWCRHIRNLAKVYNITDPLLLIDLTPFKKEDFKNYIRTMITIYYEKKLRYAAQQNSKMLYLNVSVKGLNGKPHPALENIVGSSQVKKAHAHIKMLCMDLYTYEMKASFQGGSPNCRLCEPSATPFMNVENLSHIIAICDAYKDIRRRILLQIEIVVRQSANHIDFQCILLNKELLTQFILDCTSLNLPTRVSPSDEVCPRIFQLSRDLCFSILKKRISMLRDKT